MALELRKESPGFSEADIKPYTPVQWRHLVRLSDMLVQRANLLGKIDPSDWRWKLVDRACFSDWLMCQELGLTDEVEQVMNRIKSHGEEPVSLLPAPSSNL